MVTWNPQTTDHSLNIVLKRQQYTLLLSMWKQCCTASKRLPKCIRFVIWPVRGRPESVDYIRDKRGYKRAPLFHCLKFRYTSAPFYFRTIAQLRGKREEKKKKLLQTVNKIPRTNRQSGFKCTMGRRPLTFLTNNSSVLPFQGFCYRKKEWRLNCFHRKMRRFPSFYKFHG